MSYTHSMDDNLLQKFLKVKLEAKNFIENSYRLEKPKHDKTKYYLIRFLRKKRWKDFEIRELIDLASNETKIKSTSVFKNYKPDGGKVTEYKNIKFFQGGSTGLKK